MVATEVQVCKYTTIVTYVDSVSTVFSKWCQHRCYHEWHISSTLCKSNLTTGYYCWTTGDQISYTPLTSLTITFKRQKINTLESFLMQFSPILCNISTTVNTLFSNFSITKKMALLKMVTRYFGTVKECSPLKLLWAIISF